MMLERGVIVGATRLFKRAWQLYVAYIVLFVIYIVTIGDVATRYAAPDIIYEFNVAGLVDHPIRTLAHGLFLQSKALNLDVLQLYIILMALFPPVLWMMLRKPDLTMAGSLALYLAARQFEWNLPSFPDGNWYFNPFCWQLLFVFGAWLALGGSRTIRAASQLTDPALSRHRLSGFCAGHDDGGAFPGIRKHVPGLAVRRVQSQRQGKSRAVSRLAFHRPGILRDAICAEGLARTAMADLPAGHHMRPAIAFGILRSASSSRLSVTSP